MPGDLPPTDRNEPVSLAQARAVAETMQALASPSRVQILDRLRRSPCAVGELAAAVGLEQNTLSNHLRLLRHLDLVVSERRGRNVIYALHDDHVVQLLEQVLEHVAHLHGPPDPGSDDVPAGPATSVASAPQRLPTRER